MRGIDSRVRRVIATLVVVALLLGPYYSPTIDASSIAPTNAEVVADVFPADGPTWGTIDSDNPVNRTSSYHHVYNVSDLLGDVTKIHLLAVGVQHPNDTASERYHTTTADASHVTDPLGAVSPEVTIIVLCRMEVNGTWDNCLGVDLHGRVGATTLASNASTQPENTTATGTAIPPLDFRDGNNLYSHRADWTDHGPTWGPWNLSEHDDRDTYSLLNVTIPAADVPTVLKEPRLPVISLFDCSVEVVGQIVGSCREPLWRTGPNGDDGSQGTSVDLAFCEEARPTRAQYNDYVDKIQTSGLSQSTIETLENSTVAKWIDSCRSVTDRVEMSWQGLQTSKARTETIGSLHDSIYSSTGIWTGERGYFFGGSGPDYLPDIHAFDPASGSLDKLGATLPSRRDSAASVWSGSHAYIFGGRNGSTWRMDDIVKFSPTNNSAWTLDESLPKGTSMASAVWVEDRAYIFGGPYRKSIIRFDPATGTATELDAELTSARRRTGAFYDGDAVYILGGWNAEDGYLKEVLRFDPVDETIHKLNTSNVTLPADYPTGPAVWTGDAALQFNGDTVVRVDPNSQHPNQTNTSALPTPVDRGRTAGIWTNGTGYIFGGYCDGCDNILSYAFNTQDAIEDRVRNALAAHYPDHPPFPNASTDYPPSVPLLRPDFDLTITDVDVHDNGSWHDPDNPARVHGGRVRVQFDLTAPFWTTAGVETRGPQRHEQLTVYVEPEPIDDGELVTAGIRADRGDRSLAGGTTAADPPENRDDILPGTPDKRPSNLPWLQTPDASSVLSGHWTGSADTLLEACVRELWSHSARGAVPNANLSGPARFAAETAQDQACTRLRGVINLTWPTAALPTLEIRRGDEFRLNVSVAKQSPRPALDGLDDVDPHRFNLGVGDVDRWTAPWSPNSTRGAAFGPDNHTFAVRTVAVLPSNLSKAEASEAAVFLAWMLQDQVSAVAVEAENLPLTRPSKVLLEDLTGLPILVPAGTLPPDTRSLSVYDKLYTLRGLAAHPAVVTIGSGSLADGVDPWSRLGPNPQLMPKPDFLAPSPNGTTIGAVLNVLPMVEMVQLAGIQGPDRLKTTLAALAIPYNGSDPVHNHYMQGYGVIDPSTFIDDAVGLPPLNLADLETRSRRALGNGSQGLDPFLGNLSKAENPDDLVGVATPPGALDPVQLGSMAHLSLDAPVVPGSLFTDWGVTNYNKTKAARLRLLDVDPALEAGVPGAEAAFANLTTVTNVTDRVVRWNRSLANVSLAGPNDVNVRTRHYQLFDLVEEDLLYGLHHDLSTTEAPDVDGGDTAVQQLEDETGPLLPPRRRLVEEVNATIGEDPPDRSVCLDLATVIRYVRQLASYLQAQSATAAAMERSGAPGTGIDIPDQGPVLDAVPVDREECHEDDIVELVDRLETVRGDLHNTTRAYDPAPNASTWNAKYGPPLNTTEMDTVLDATADALGTAEIALNTTANLDRTHRKLGTDLDKVIPKIEDILARTIPGFRPGLHRRDLDIASLPDQTRDAPLGPYVGLTSVTTRNVTTVNPLTGNVLDRTNVTVPIPSLLWNNPTVDVRIQYRDGMPVPETGLILHNPDYRVFDRYNVQVNRTWDDIEVPLYSHLLDRLPAVHNDSRQQIPPAIRNLTSDVHDELNASLGEAYNGTIDPEDRSVENLSLALATTVLDRLASGANITRSDGAFATLDDYLTDLYSKPEVESGRSNQSGHVIDPADPKRRPAIDQLFPVASVQRYYPYSYSTLHNLSENHPYAGIGDEGEGMEDSDLLFHRQIRDQLIRADGALSRTDPPHWGHGEPPDGRVRDPVRPGEDEIAYRYPIREVHEDRTGAYHQFGFDLNATVGNPIELTCLLLEAHNARFGTDVASPFSCRDIVSRLGPMSLDQLPVRLAPLLCDQADANHTRACLQGLDAAIGTANFTADGTGPNVTQGISACRGVLDHPTACPTLVSSLAILVDLLGPALEGPKAWTATVPFVHSLSRVMDRYDSELTIDEPQLVNATAELNDVSTDKAQDAVENYTANIPQDVAANGTVDEPPREDDDTYTIAQGLKSHGGDRVSGLDWTWGSVPPSVDNETTQGVVDLLNRTVDETGAHFNASMQAWSQQRLEALEDWYANDPATLIEALDLDRSEVDNRTDELAARHEGHVATDGDPPLADNRSATADNRPWTPSPATDEAVDAPASADEPTELTLGLLNRSLTRLGFRPNNESLADSLSGTDVTLSDLIRDSNASQRGEWTAKALASRFLNQSYHQNESAKELARKVLLAERSAGAWEVDQYRDAIRASSSTMLPKVGAFSHSVPLAPQEAMTLHTDGEYYFQNTDAFLIATPHDVIRDAIMATVQPMGQLANETESPEERTEALTTFLEVLSQMLTKKKEDSYIRIRHLNPPARVEHHGDLDATGGGRSDHLLSRYGSLRVQNATDTFEFQTKGIYENQFGFDEMHFTYVFFPLLDHRTVGNVSRWVKANGVDVDDPSVDDPGFRTQEMIEEELNESIEETGSKFIISDFGVMWDTYVGFNNKRFANGDAGARLTFPNPMWPNVEDLKVYWGIPADPALDASQDLTVTAESDVTGVSLDRSQMNYTGIDRWQTGNDGWNLECPDTYMPGRWYTPTAHSPRGIGSGHRGNLFFSEDLTCASNAVHRLDPATTPYRGIKGVVNAYSQPVKRWTSWRQYDTNLDGMPFERFTSGGPYLGTIPTDHSVLYRLLRARDIDQTGLDVGAGLGTQSAVSDARGSLPTGAVDDVDGLARDLERDWGLDGLVPQTAQDLGVRPAPQSYVPAEVHMQNGSGPSVSYFAVLNETRLTELSRDPTDPRQMVDRPLMRVEDREGTREKSWSPPEEPPTQMPDGTTIHNGTDHQVFDLTQRFEPGLLTVALDALLNPDASSLYTGATVLQGFNGQGVSVRLKGPAGTSDDGTYGDAFPAGFEPDSVDVWLAEGGDKTSSTGRCWDVTLAGHALEHAVCWNAKDVAETVDDTTSDRSEAFAKAATVRLIDTALGRHGLDRDNAAPVLWPLYQNATPPAASDRAVQTIRSDAMLNVSATGYGARDMAAAATGIDEAVAGGFLDETTYAAATDVRPHMTELPATLPLPRRIDPVHVTLDLPVEPELRGIDVQLDPTVGSVHDPGDIVVRVDTWDPLDKVVEYDVTRKAESPNGSTEWHNFTRPSAEWRDDPTNVTDAEVTYMVRPVTADGILNQSVTSQPVFVNFTDPLAELLGKVPLPSVEVPFGVTAMNGSDLWERWGDVQARAAETELPGVTDYQLGLGRDGVTTLGPNATDSSIPFTLRAVHDHPEVDVTRVEVFRNGDKIDDATQDPDNATRWHFDWPTETPARNTRHNLSFLVHADNTLSARVNASFYFADDDKLGSIEDRDESEWKLEPGGGTAELGHKTRWERCDSSGCTWFTTHMLEVDADTTTTARATWTETVPSTRLALNATMKLDRKDDSGRFDLLQVQDNGTERVSVYVDGSSTELKLSGVRNGPVNTGFNVSVGNWTDLRLVVSERRADLYVGPFFLGSHRLNASGTGLSGVAFGGTGARAFWDEIGVRTGRLDFSRLQAADPVDDADGWTVEGNGSVTVGTDAAAGNYTRLVPQDSSFTAYAPDLNGGFYSRLFVYFNATDAQNGAATVVAGLENGTGAELLRVYVDDGRVNVTDGLGPSGTERPHRTLATVGENGGWHRLDLKLAGPRYVAALNQTTWAEARTFSSDAPARLFAGSSEQGGTPQEVHLDRIGALTDGLDFENEFHFSNDSSLQERGWNVTDDPADDTSTSLTGVLSPESGGLSQEEEEALTDVAGRLFEVESNSEEVETGFAARPKRSLGATYVGEATFRPRKDNTSIDNQTILGGMTGKDGLGGMDWAVTMDTGVDDTWAVYWHPPGGLKTKISDDFDAADWHHVRVIVNETGGHAAIFVDEEWVYEEVDLDFEGSERLVVGDVSEETKDESGGGTGWYGGIVAFPAPLSAPPDCAGTCVEAPSINDPDPGIERGDGGDDPHYY